MIKYTNELMRCGKVNRKLLMVDYKDCLRDKQTYALSQKKVTFEAIAYKENFNEVQEQG